MANRKISTVPDTAVVGDLVGTQFTIIDDIVVAKTKKVTLAVLRRALFAGGAGYTSTDPITAGIATLARITPSGASLLFGTDAAGVNAAATAVTFDAPQSTGNAVPAALIERVGALGSTGASAQTLTEFWRKRGSASNATTGELVFGFATLRIIPGATALAFRDSTNASDAFTMNAAGTTFTFPLATAVVFGTDPAGSQLLRVGGSARFGGAVQLDSTLTVVGDLILTPSGADAIIRVNTTDAADNDRVLILGGAAALVTRGGYIVASGNEHAASAGQVLLVAGAVAGAYVGVNGLFGSVTDNTNDFGEVAAKRFRDFFLGRNATIGGTLWVTGVATFTTTLTQNGALASLAQGAATSTLTVGTGAGSGATAINIQSAAGQFAILRWAGASSSVRWQITKDGDAETGGNAGSRQLFQAFGDAGAFIDNWLAVTRAAAGAIAFSAIRPITGGTYNGNTLGTTTVTFPAATAFVIGTDPGGSGVLRVGGGARVGGNVVVHTTSAATFLALLHSQTDGGISISGGNATTVGGNARFFGSTHPTQANDVEFRSGSTARGFYDDSAALWEFSNAASMLTRFSTPAAGGTSLWLYDADNATLERVTVGIADSGGAGYKLLRIPN